MPTFTSTFAVDVLVKASFVLLMGFALNLALFRASGGPSSAGREGGGWKSGKACLGAVAGGVLVALPACQ